MSFDPYDRRPPRTRSGPRLSHVVAAVFSALFFASGYLYGQADAAQGQHALVPLLRRFSIDPSRVGVVTTAPDLSVLTDSERRNVQAFWETWNYVNRDFFPQDRVNREQMVYAAIRGMLDTLEDPNTVFLSPAQRQLADADLRGSFDGVGIQVDIKDGEIRVVAPIDGSPAQEAGMLPGDIVTHVDDTDVRGFDLNDVVPLIRGPRGSSVRLTVRRADADAPLVFTMARAEIRVQNVRARMLDQQIAYVRIASFSRTAPEDLAARLKEIQEQQPTALVLDLRSNPGGFVTAAVEMTSQFLDDGVIFYQRSAGGEDQEFRARGQGLMTGVPIAVLMNRGTASAAEITAAALRDAGRAVLIGEKTFGKGTVQSVRQLTDGSGIRITSAQWLTPGKEPIHGNGLQPQIPVEAPLTPALDNDPAINEAVRYLTTTIAQQKVAVTP